MVAMTITDAFVASFNFELSLAFEIFSYPIVAYFLFG